MKSKLLWVLSTALIFSTAYAADKNQNADQALNRDEFFQAVQICAEETGTELTEGQHPTKEQRQVIHACLKEKGIVPPQHIRGQCKQEQE